MDAGSITIRVNGDMTDLESAFNNLNKKIDESKNKTGDMGKEFLKAQVIFEGFKRAAELVIDVVGSAIEAFKETELAESRLASVTGNNIQAFKDFAGQIQKATTIEDDAVIKALSYAKTLGVQTSAIKDVTQQAIGLSKAFGIDLEQSVRMITLAQQGNSELLKRFIPELRTATTEVQRQSIIQKAVANGWAIARNEAETFTGKLQQLKNAQSDISEDLGRIISVIGKDLVTAWLDATRGITDFMNSAEGIRIISGVVGNISASLAIFQEVATKLGTAIKTYLAGIVETLTTNFGKLFGSADKTNIVMIGLSSVVQSISASFAIMGKVINLVVTTIADLAKAIIETGKLQVAFAVMMANPFDEKNRAKFTKQLEDAGESYKNFGLNLFNNTKDLVTTTISEFSKMGSEINKNANAWTDEYKQKLKTTQQEIQDSMSGILPGETTGSGGGEPTPKAKSPGKISISLDISLITDAINIIAGLLGNMSNNISATISKAFNDIGNAFNEAKTAFADTTKTWQEKAEAAGKVISGVASSIGGAFSSVMDMATKAVADSFSKQLTAAQELHTSEIAGIEEKLATELELIENDGKTKSEKRQADMTALEEQLAVETDDKKKAGLQEQFDALKKEKAIEDAKKKADKEKALSDYKLAKTNYELSKQQFEINKTLQIVQASIAYALGLVQLWANVWSLGPIAGAIMGGIMTGVLTGIYAAQVGLIASMAFPSQQPTPPAFAVGTGSAPGGRALVGELGPEQVNLPPGSEVLPAGMTAWNSAPQIINLIVDGDIIKTWMINNQRSEALY